MPFIQLHNDVNHVLFFFINVRISFGSILVLNVKLIRSFQFRKATNNAIHPIKRMSYFRPTLHKNISFWQLKLHSILNLGDPLTGNKRTLTYVCIFKVIVLYFFSIIYDSLKDFIHKFEEKKWTKDVFLIFLNNFY